MYVLSLTLICGHKHNRGSKIEFSFIYLSLSIFCFRDPLHFSLAYLLRMPDHCLN